MDGKEPTALATRPVSMTRNGRYVAIRQSRGVDVVDALGTSPRQSIEVEAVDFGYAGGELWVVTRDGLLRHTDDGVPRREASPIAEVHGPGSLQIGTSERSTRALWRGERDRHLSCRDGRVEVAAVSEVIARAEFAMPVGDTGYLLSSEGHKTLVDGARVRSLPGTHRLLAASELFGGRVLALFERTVAAGTLLVVQPTGARIHRIDLGDVDGVTFAETRGLAVAWSGAEVRAIDLRYGRELGRGEVPMPIDGVCLDSAGKFVAVAGRKNPAATTLTVLHLPYTSLFSTRTRAAVPATGDHGDAPAPAEDADPTATAGIDAVLADSAPSDGGGQDEDAAPGVEETAAAAPRSIPDTPPTALGPLPSPPSRGTAGDAPPYDRPEQHLEDLVDLIAAKAAKGIADAWNSGRLSLPALDSLPFEHEVRALVGDASGVAEDAVRAASERVLTLARNVTARATATLATGQALPFFEVVAEFGLSRTAAQALTVAAAPQIRGEIARLYGVLANDEGRPICDRYLIELILGGDDRDARNAVARELEPDAALLHHGLVRALPAPPDMYLFQPITVDPVLIARLRGHPFAGYEIGSVTEIERGDRELAELAIDRGLLHDIVTDLAEPPLDGRPVRVVVRGRPGSGRTTLVTALASRIGRAVAMIDCERLPRDGRALAQRLRLELRRARLRGALPCVSGLEISESAEAEGVEHILEVFRSHPGPILVRTTPEYRPPLEPGYLSYTIPPLGESDRLAFWQRATGAAGLPVTDPALLAARFRIGPGTIERVVRTVKMRVDAGAIGESGDYTDVLDRAARQHIDTRLSSVANRVDRLARWDQVALPAEVLDSVREFIGRVRHRRTVYEAWGFDRKMSTSRGLTALFYGAPGTGKTMVAGLIARELDLELYRVDLARITSKWVGETEKNLAQVFDAAEDGQAVIVFDEADSLFARRTEVKSSVDRYANLEVNYLLQRLDSFEGIAILTTNLEGSIDSAFKRRLSLRLAFPFPDEDMRVRLWAAHIPPELPTAGDFDFDDLAARFPMSGGYIRNCTLRAAFLAAQENVPLSQDHLLRAVQLEYQEMGKLSASGRIE